jgi:hypothetical protein
MALQIKRGPTGDRTSFTPLPGELVWDTIENALYVGDGTTVGGIPASSLSYEDAQDAAAELFSSGTHNGISFTYADTPARINASINLNGTITSNIVPAANEVYDLGTSSTRFRDLYLSGSSLHLGDAVLTSTGSAVNLPAGSTVNGVLIGSGGGNGGDFEFNVAADDSTLVSIASGETLQFAGSGGISTSSDAEGKITISLPSTLPINILGDVKGSVFGDDSSVLVDALNGNINGTTINASAALNLGSSSPFEIFKADGLATLRTSGSDVIQALTNIFYVGTINRNSQLRVYSVGTPGTDSILVQNYSNLSTANNTTFLRARGTGASPTTVANNDTIHTIKFNGYDGSSFSVGVAEISSSVNGTVSSGVVPGRLILSTANSSGTMTPAITIGSNQLVTFGSGFITNNGTAELNAYSDIAETRGLLFTRYRGTGTVPTAVQPDDQIYNIRFAGYDGTTSQVSSLIRSEVEGTVSSGTVPGRLRFLTANTSGVLTSALVIRNDQTVEVLRKMTVNNAGFELDANKDGQTSNLQLFTRSRGSAISPTAVINNDHIYTLRFSAYDGTTSQTSAQIRAEVAASPIPGTAVQGRLRLLAANASGTQISAVSITSEATSVSTLLNAQNGINISNFAKLPSYADAAARDAAITSPEAGMMIFLTSTAKFQGYDGTSWTDLN